MEEIFLKYARSKTKVVRLKISDRIEIPEPCDKFLAQKLLDISVKYRGKVSLQFFWNKDMRCFCAKYD